MNQWPRNGASCIMVYLPTHTTIRSNSSEWLIPLSQKKMSTERITKRMGTKEENKKIEQENLTHNQKMAKNNVLTTDFVQHNQTFVMSPIKMLFFSCRRV